MKLNWKSICSVCTAALCSAVLFTACSGDPPPQETATPTPTATAAPVSPSPAQTDGLEGTWYFTGQGRLYEFDGRGGFTYTEEGVAQQGTYTYEVYQLECRIGDQVFSRGVLGVDGTLHFDDDPNEWYYRAGTGGLPLYFADDYDLWGNAHLNDGRITLDAGCACEGSRPEDYTVIPMDWDVFGGSITAEADGLRTVEFTAAACFLKDAIPDIPGGSVEHAGYVFYDAASGTLLPETAYYRVDGEQYTDEGLLYHYLYSFEVNGQIADLDMTVEIVHLGELGDCNDVVEHRFMITMPDWYTGLIFAAVPQPDSLSLFHSLWDDEALLLGMKANETDNLDIHNALRWQIQ